MCFESDSGGILFHFSLKINVKDDFFSHYNPNSCIFIVYSPYLGFPIFFLVLVKH